MTAGELLRSAAEALDRKAEAATSTLTRDVWARLAKRVEVLADEVTYEEVFDLESDRCH